MTPLTSEHTLGKCFLSRVPWTKCFFEDPFRSPIFRKVSGNAAKKLLFSRFWSDTRPCACLLQWDLTCPGNEHRTIAARIFFPHLTFHNSIGQYLFVHFHSQFCRFLLARFFRSTYIFRPSNHWKTTAFPLSFRLSCISQCRAGVISAAPPESPPCWFRLPNFCAFCVRGKKLFNWIRAQAKSTKMVKKRVKGNLRIK